MAATAADPDSLHPALRSLVGAVDTVDAPTVVLLPDRTVLAVSTAFTAVTGVPASAAVGTDGADLLADPLAAIGVATGELVRRLATDPEDRIRLHGRTSRHGDDRHGGLTVTRYRHEGSVIALVATLSGTTRPSTVADDDHVERRPLALVDDLSVAVAVQVDGRIAYANRAVEELFGVEGMDAIGERIRRREHVHPDERGRLERRLAELDDDDGGWTPESSRWRLVRPDGTERVVDWQTARVEMDGRPGRLFTVHDVTAVAAATEALAASEAYGRAVFDNAGEGLAVLDAEGRFVDANPAFAAIHGLPSAAEIVGRGPIGGRLVDRDGEPLQEPPSLACLRTGDRVGPTILGVDLPTGRRWLESLAVPLQQFDQPVHGVLLSVHDVTEQLELRDRLAESERRFRELAELSPDVIIRIALRPNVSVEFVSPSFAALVGADPVEPGGSPAVLLRHVHPDDREHLVELGTAPATAHATEFRVVHADGTVRTVDARSVPVRRRGEVDAVDVTIRDVSAQAARTSELFQLAHRDVLTGLLNRRAFVATLSERLARGERTTLLFLDLDGFKAVNDRLGHDSGDTVLVVAAQRIATHVRTRDLVGRFAGDEFVVATSPEAAAAIAERLVVHLSEPVHLSDGEEAGVGVSVGMAEWAPGEDVETLFRRADEAMYRAKRGGKGRTAH